MKPKYLKLLLSIAATKEQAVPSKQNLIYKMLLVDKHDLQIHTRIDESESSGQTLPVNEQTISSYSCDGGGEVLGHELLHHVPVVEVTWNTTHKGFSCIELYGKKRVSLVEFSQGQGEDPQVHEDLATPEGRRALIFDYYYYQLKLFSALCMDRNYLTINHIERNMTYGMLVALITNEELPVRLRTQYCRLFKALWIDRSPQRAICIPIQVSFLLSLYAFFFFLVYSICLMQRYAKTPLRGGYLTTTHIHYLPPDAVLELRWGAAKPARACQCQQICSAAVVHPALLHEPRVIFQLLQ